MRRASASEEVRGSRDMRREIGFLIAQARALSPFLVQEVKRLCLKRNADMYESASGYFNALAL